MIGSEVAFASFDWGPHHVSELDTFVKADIIGVPI